MIYQRKDKICQLTSSWSKTKTISTLRTNFKQQQHWSKNRWKPSSKQIRQFNENKCTNMYLHISISSGAKCFSQVYIASLSDCSLKFWSISLVFFIFPSHSSRHFPWASYFATGSFQIPIPFVRLHKPQPNTEPLAPCITFIFLAKWQPHTDVNYGEI